MGRQDLAQFLAGKCVSPQNEASVIWSLLINNSAHERYTSHGLPLDLTCDVCGKKFGECEHNSHYHELFERTQYMPKQTPHWMIEVRSLREARRALEYMEIRLLGNPENPGQRRQLLYAWIDSL